MFANVIGSRIWLAVKAGLGAVLICTALLHTTWKVFKDAVEVAYGQPFGFADSRFLGMLLTGIVGPLFFAGILGLIGFFCIRRCRTVGDGLIASGAALWLMVLPTVLSFVSRKALLLYSVLPAVFLAEATSARAAGYLGSAVQLVLGAWLLGWFRRLEAKQGNSMC